MTAEEFINLLGRIVDKKSLPIQKGTPYLENEMADNTWSYEAYITFTQVLGNEGKESRKLGEQEIKLVLGNTDKEVLENYKKVITREKAASLIGAIFEAIDNEEPNSSSVNKLNAKDWDKVNSVYKQKINLLAEMNIFRGTVVDDEIYVNPDVELTRVEAIVLADRFCKCFTMIGNV